MIRKIIFIVFIFSIGYSQYRDIPEVVTKVATSTANWLKVETGVRAIGMGGAFVAAGKGISAVPYNPSGIGFLGQSEAYYSKSNFLAGISHNVLGYGRKLTSQDFVGLHLFYLNSGAMEVTNEFFPNGTGEEFSVISMSLRGTYARRLTDRLKVGVSLNYLRDQLFKTVTMQGVSFDIGSNFSTGIYGMVLGMSITNFGPEVRYGGPGLNVTVADTIDVDGQLSRVTKEFPLPLTFRLGLKNDVIGKESDFVKSEVHRLTLAADGIKANDYTVYGNVGMEYGYREFGFVRAGYRLGHDTAGLSAGGGLRYPLNRGITLLVDYAFVDYGILELTHQFSLSVEF
tara:strand:+ start:98 stop:1123 length:1026 start_codon:yes stop_codon:yes gene_type:complete